MQVTYYYELIFNKDIYIDEELAHKKDDVYETALGEDYINEIIKDKDYQIALYYRRNMIMFDKSVLDIVRVVTVICREKYD